MRSKKVQSTHTNRDSNNMYDVMAVLFTNGTGALGRTRKFYFEISSLSKEYLGTVTSTLYVIMFMCKIEFSIYFRCYQYI
jgi:hypothetical protein